MTERPKRSIGKMETWEPPDKSFSKHTFHDGYGEETPNDGAVCTVNLMLLDNDNVDIDVALMGGYKFGEDVEVTIGEGDTVLSEHLDKIIMSMKKDETCYIKSKVDFTGNKISELQVAKESLSAVKFNAHLKTFDRAAEMCDLEQDERLERAQHCKTRGTELFKQNNLQYAIKRYQKSLEYLVDMECHESIPCTLTEQYRTLRCQCNLNLAACALKQEKYEDVISYSTQALDLEPDNVKGLFRRGQAYNKLNQYPEARADFSRTLSLDPSNKAAVNQLRTVEALIKKEKQMYQKMFT